MTIARLPQLFQRMIVASIITLCSSGLAIAEDVTQNVSSPFTLKFSPSVTVDAGRKRAVDEYFGLNPGLGISTEFLAPGGKKASFSVNYTLSLVEYTGEDEATDEPDNRSIGHSVGISLTYPQSDKLKFKLGGVFEMERFKSEQQSKDNDGNFYQIAPSVSYQVHERVGLTAKYAFNNFVSFSPGATPNFEGVDGAAGGGLLGTDSGATDPDDPDLGAGIDPALLKDYEESYIWQTLGMSSNIKVIDSTSLKLGLTYEFGNQRSPNPTASLFDNGIIMTAEVNYTFDLPYIKGLSISPSYYRRARSMKNGDKATRQRFAFSASYSVLDWLSVDAGYTLEKNVTDKKDGSKKKGDDIPYGSFGVTATF